MGGYTAIVEKMLEGSEVMLNTDYFEFIKDNPMLLIRLFIPE